MDSNKLKCEKHGRRVLIGVSAWNDSVTVSHRTGNMDRCDSDKFVIGNNTYTAAQIVAARS